MDIFVPYSLNLVLYFFSRGVYGFFFTLYPVIVSDIHIFIKMVIFVMEIYSMWFLK